MLKVVRLTVNGNSTQVTIPRRMLDALSWRAGEFVVLTLREDKTLGVERASIGTASRGVFDPVSAERQTEMFK